MDRVVALTDRQHDCMHNGTVPALEIGAATLSMLGAAGGPRHALLPCTHVPVGLTLRRRPCTSAASLVILPSTAFSCGRENTEQMSMLQARGRHRSGGTQGRLLWGHTGCANRAAPQHQDQVPTSPVLSHARSRLTSASNTPRAPHAAAGCPPPWSPMQSAGNGRWRAAMRHRRLTGVGGRWVTSQGEVRTLALAALSSKAVLYRQPL